MVYYKKIFIIIFFILLFCFLNSTCYAFSVPQTTYTGSTYNCYIPDSCYSTLQGLSIFSDTSYKYFCDVADGYLHCFFFDGSMPLNIWKTGNTTFRSNKDSISNFECIYYQIRETTGAITSTDEHRTNFATSTSNYSYYANGSNHYFLTNMTIYANNSINPEEYFHLGTYNGGDIAESPSFVSTASQLSSDDNQNIVIFPGDFSDSLYLRLYDSTNNKLFFNVFLSDYDDYIEREDLDNPFSDLVYKIPYSVLPAFSFESGNDYEFRLVYVENDVLKNISVFFTPSFSFNSDNTTNTDINNSINQTNEELQDINSSINQTNEQLEDLNNNITSDDISGVSSSDLPSISVNDPTSDGLASIFTNMYNAFCTGNAQNIVLPIPHTNKNITIDPYYLQNQLQSHNAGWFLTFIQAYWGYLFGRFIIKDMASKIRKIKSGNIEGLQNSNIKEEML